MDKHKELLDIVGSNTCNHPSVEVFSDTTDSSRNRVISWKRGSAELSLRIDGYPSLYWNGEYLYDFLGQFDEVANVITSFVLDVFEERVLVGRSPDGGGGPIWKGESTLIGVKVWCTDYGTQIRSWLGTYDQEVNNRTAFDWVNWES
jgi:hypothetical protein